VHFLRFELSMDMRASLKAGASLIFGIDHANYEHRAAALAEATRETLLRDLD